MPLKETWTITGNDGSDWAFEIERGSKSDASTRKFDKSSCARFIHSNGSESQIHWNEFDDCFKIALSSLRPELRGQGIGLALYKRIVDEAARVGKGFSSDDSVSSEALKIYPKLAALGYAVEYAPDHNVSVTPLVQRGDMQNLRPEGSTQIVGRDNMSVVRILPPGMALKPALPPIYLMNALAANITFDQSANGPPVTVSPTRDVFFQSLGLTPTSLNIALEAKLETVQSIAQQAQEAWQELSSAIDNNMDVGVLGKMFGTAVEKTVSSCQESGVLASEQTSKTLVHFGNTIQSLAVMDGDMSTRANVDTTMAYYRRELDPQYRSTMAESTPGFSF